MSSINCPRCLVRVWDKYLGNLVSNKNVNGIIYCLKCAKEKSK